MPKGHTGRVTTAGSQPKERASAEVADSFSQPRPGEKQTEQSCQHSTVARKKRSQGRRELPLKSSLGSHERVAGKVYSSGLAARRRRSSSFMLMAHSAKRKTASGM